MKYQFIYYIWSIGFSFGYNNTGKTWLSWKRITNIVKRMTWAKMYSCLEKQMITSEGGIDLNFLKSWKIWMWHTLFDQLRILEFRSIYDTQKKEVATSWARTNCRWINCRRIHYFYTFDWKAFLRLHKTQNSWRKRWIVFGL